MFEILLHMWKQLLRSGLKGQGVTTVTCWDFAVAAAVLLENFGVMYYFSIWYP